MLLEPGQLIDDKYRIVRLLGKGGMGAVYEGHHELIDRRIAIKTLLPHAAQEGAAVRFEREARAAGRIGNDHILEIYDIGSLQSGGRYMVMEYLDGETFSDRIKRGNLQEPEVVRLTLQLLNGLGAAHNAGVLHRDLKPDNIFLVAQKAGVRDFVKIIDFGISKFNLGEGEMRMTATGMVMGTPYYIAPEVAKGLGDVDLRADIYAVGVILYEAISGRVPFDADNFNNLLFKIVLEEAPPLASVVPNVDPDLAVIVHKAMAREKEQRYGSCAEMAEALQDWATMKGVPLDATMSAGMRPSQVSLSDQLEAGVPTGPATIQATAPNFPTPGAFGASQAVETVSRPKPVGLLVGVGVAALALGVALAIGLSGGDEPEQLEAAASVQPAEASEAIPEVVTPPPPAEEPKEAAAQAEPEETDQGSTDKKPEETAKEATADAAAAKNDVQKKDTSSTPAQSATTSTQTSQPRATSPAPAPARPATPAPQPTAKPRRNFGY